MVRIRQLKSLHPWRNALVATTGLSVLAVAVSALWSSGYPQWAFLVAFVAVWALLALIWSNDDFNQASDQLLAQVVDINFEDVHRRLLMLESTVNDADDSADAASNAGKLNV